MPQNYFKQFEFEENKLYPAGAHDKYLSNLVEEPEEKVERSDEDMSDYYDKER